MNLLLASIIIKYMIMAMNQIRFLFMNQNVQEYDKKLRQKLKGKDIDLSKQLQSQMQKQQDLLKNYFQQYKRMIKQNPKVVKKMNNNNQKDRSQIFKSALSSVSIFQNFYQEFWKVHLKTPEQRIALKLAKDNIVLNVLKCAMGSLIITTFTSYKVRMFVRWPTHLLSIFTGIGTGIILGISLSTQFTFQQLQKLGDNYDFSRKVIQDLQKNRMDKR